MTPSSTTRRAFFEKIGVAGAAVGALASLETARGYAANDYALGRLPGHRRAVPALDEVAGPGSRREDRRGLRRLRRGARQRARSSPTPRRSRASTIASCSTARTSTPS